MCIYLKYNKFLKIKSEISLHTQQYGYHMTQKFHSQVFTKMKICVHKRLECESS
jgi:hypothetical protein